MPFGPELLVIRDIPSPGKVDQISLGAFNPGDMPTFPSEDPAHRFLHPLQAAALQDYTAHTRYLDRQVEGWDTIIWGVSDESAFRGYVALGLDDGDPNFVHYGITLHPSARGRGIGSLATSAVLKAVFTNSLLHRKNK